MLRKAIELCEWLQTNQDDVSLDKFFLPLFALFSKLSEHIPNINADTTTHWILFHKWFELLWSCSKLTEIDLRNLVQSFIENCSSLQTLLVLQAVKSFVVLEKNPNTNINLPTTHIHRLVFLMLLKAWLWMQTAPSSLEGVKELVEAIYKHYKGL